jgi:hypothetical protein
MWLCYLLGIPIDIPLSFADSCSNMVRIPNEETWYNFHVEKARKAHLLLQKAIINIYVNEIGATRHHMPSVV